MAGSKVKKQIPGSGQDQKKYEYVAFGRNFDSTIDGSPPNTYFQLNSAAFSTVTSIDINVNDLQDESVIINTIVSGTKIKLTALDDPDRSAIFTATGAPVTGSVPVTYDEDAGSFFINEEGVGISLFQEAASAGVTEIIGGVALSSSSNTNILDGTYVILADTTTATSVTSGIGQDSNWTLEVTQASITNQKGVIIFSGNLEKDAGGGQNYDIAIFKNGSIISESEQIDQKLESGGKGQSVTVSAIVEFSTNDTFSIRVSGNGTADDIFCGGGSLYLR